MNKRGSNSCSVKEIVPEYIQSTTLEKRQFGSTGRLITPLIPS